jgi:hypothetical protein
MRQDVDGAAVTTDWTGLLPRAVWVWTTPPPDGRRVQIWVDTAGQPLGYDVDVSDLTPPGAQAAGTTPDAADLRFAAVAMPRVTTPRLDEVTLAALLVQCRP